MPVRALTGLPDVSQPTLDATVEDEITVSWVDTIDYGEYQVEIEETGTAWSSSPVGLATVPHDGATEHTFTGLEDGEQYKVRLRTQTEHKTGSWTSDETEITTLPAPSSVSATPVSGTDIDLTWTDNSDAEAGFRVMESVRHPEDGWQGYAESTTVSPDTTSTTYTTAQPGRDYRFKVEAYTDDTTSRSPAYSEVTTVAEFPCGRGGVIHPFGDYEEIWNTRVEGDWVVFGDVKINSDTNLSLVLEGQFDIHATIEHLTGDAIIRFGLWSRQQNALANIKFTGMAAEKFYRFQFDGVLAKTAGGRAHGKTTKSGTIQFTDVEVPYE